MRSAYVSANVAAVPEDPPDDSTFTQAEARLLELAKALDAPIEPSPYRLALVALGQRCRTLFVAFSDVQRGGAPAAAQALIRPMVEINVLIRFLNLSPDLHTELWEAEGERNAMTIVDEVKASEHLSARWAVLGEWDTSAFDARRANVELIRAKALKADVPGVRKKGNVLPTTSQQLRAVDEHAAYESYTLVYRPLSWDVHGGARSLLDARFIEGRDGLVTFVEDTTPSVGARALAISTFASTLKLCGYHLGLGIEDDAAEVLESFVPQSPEFPK
ncbi:MAG: DUF5677 domain-containing protein [Solirubrobacteraceae bacterium]